MWSCNQKLAMNTFSTIGNQLAQERFNKKANVWAFSFLMVAFVAAFINYASKLN